MIYDYLKLDQLGSQIFWVLKFHFKDPKHNALMWIGPWKLENVQISLKSLKTLILTYKYSSYASNQNPS